MLNYCVNFSQFQAFALFHNMTNNLLSFEFLQVLQLGAVLFCCFAGTISGPFSMHDFFYQKHPHTSTFVYRFVDKASLDAILDSRLLLRVHFRPAVFKFSRTFVILVIYTIKDFNFT